ncbi:hypothetical protein [Pyrococcus kukulkanii]|uniref:Uncharacterized protein n=1 Tax=Pyrococcus kukulkanii TaxID=1609559 RepID=A0ABV4T5K8_9EURY
MQGQEAIFEEKDMCGNKVIVTRKYITISRKNTVFPFLRKTLSLPTRSVTGFKTRKISKRAVILEDASSAGVFMYYVFLIALIEEYFMHKDWPAWIYALILGIALAFLSLRPIAKLAKDKGSDALEITLETPVGEFKGELVPCGTDIGRVEEFFSKLARVNKKFWRPT